VGVVPATIAGLVSGAFINEAKPNCLFALSKTT